jgi:hypothetical protein
MKFQKILIYETNCEILIKYAYEDNIIKKLDFLSIIKGKKKI